MYVKTMKGSKIKMKEGIVPHKFECQNRSTDKTSNLRPCYLKRERTKLIDTLLAEEPEGSAKNEHEEPPISQDCQNTHDSNKEDKSLQVNLKLSKRSKAVQCTLLSDKIDSAKKRKSIEPLQSSLVKKMCFRSDSSLSSSTTSSAFSPSSSGSSSSNSTFNTWNSNMIQNRAFYIIEKNPKLYLGIQKKIIIHSRYTFFKVQSSSSGYSNITKKIEN